MVVYGVLVLLAGVQNVTAFADGKMMRSNLHENDVPHENKVSSTTIRVCVTPIKCTMVLKTESQYDGAYTPSLILAAQPNSNHGRNAEPNQTEERSDLQNNAIKSISITCYDKQGFLFSP